MIEQGLINAIYALYGRPEPSASTPLEKIRNDLREMAAERRLQDSTKRMTESLTEE